MYALIFGSLAPTPRQMIAPKTTPIRLTPTAIRLLAEHEEPEPTPIQDSEPDAIFSTNHRFQRLVPLHNHPYCWNGYEDEAPDIAEEIALLGDYDEARISEVDIYRGAEAAWEDTHRRAVEYA
jgi:hypothetical protein